MSRYKAYDKEYDLFHNDLKLRGYDKDYLHEKTSWKVLLNTPCFMAYGLMRRAQFNF